MEQAMGIEPTVWLTSVRERTVEKRIRSGRQNETHKVPGVVAAVPGSRHEPLNDRSTRSQRVPNSHGSFDFEETDRVVLGDIRGTSKRCLWMAGKLLTDARETSYWI